MEVNAEEKGLLLVKENLSFHLKFNYYLFGLSPNWFKIVKWSKKISKFYVLKYSTFRFSTWIEIQLKYTFWIYQ